MTQGLAVMHTTTRVVTILILMWLVSVPSISFSHIKQESQANATQNKSIIYATFIPPTKWNAVDESLLSPRVLAAYVNRSSTGFLPSINLAIENTDLTLKEYLRHAKALHQSDTKTRWRELGQFLTKTGKGQLTAIDTESKWGPVRMLQLIMMANKKAYILTASASKADFPFFHGQFKNAFSSFAITEDLTSMVHPTEKRKELSIYLETFEKEISTLNQKNHDPDALNHLWTTLYQFLDKDHHEMGSYWRLQILKMLKTRVNSLITAKDG